MSKVPSQTLAALWGSRISAAHLPHGLCLTPLYLLLLSPVSSTEAFSLDGAAADTVVAAAAAAVVAKIFADSSAIVEKDTRGYMSLPWMCRSMS